MAISKRLNLNNVFIFLFLAIFPLGQIVRIGIVQPIDLIVGMGAIYAILRKFKKPDLFIYIENFLFVAGFSWIFGVFLFHQTEIFYGLLYLFRLLAYFYFFIYVWNFAKYSPANKKLLIDALLAVSVISAVFGWIQFFRFPDIKSFFVWGWDMHLFRLVGTFLDPTFLGLIIVFGLLISVYSCINTWKRKDIVITVFLLISLAFTYSRASYLALFGGLLIISWYKKIIWKAVLSILLFGGLLFLLPTSRNHSIELLRSFSAIARVENYQTTLQIYSKSPIFGIGYDNMCIAYQKYIGPQSFASHACSGSDSSLLLVLASMGIVGLIVFFYSVFQIFKHLPSNSDFVLLSSSFVALGVHSFFSNSLFYPWILGCFMILLAVATDNSRIEG